jgi:iron complex transport system ATP-binding protein
MLFQSQTRTTPGFIKKNASPALLPINGVINAQNRTVIGMRNVTYLTVGGTALVRAFTLDFNVGSFNAVIGHNGSGKSTALKLLGRLIPPTDGEIVFGDHPISNLDQRDFARKVAYLAQEPGDGADYTVEELVGLGRYPWQGPFGRVTPNDLTAIERAIDLASLQNMRQRTVQSLSGGERQRCWIAVTLAQQAQCLLLDEPISALDLPHQLEILRLLKTLAHQDGLCIVAILHDINLAAQFADRIIALKQGSVIADAPPTDIMRPDQLEQIYNLRMIITQHPHTGHPIALPAH